HQQRERLARLRGAKLPATSPSARSIEHVQRNPACTALRTITMAGASPADVMSTVLQVPPREGQSPFAITTGLAFERHLADKGAAALFTLYRQKGRLGMGDARLVDLSLRAAPSSAAAKVRHKVLTRTLLRMKFQSDPQAPHL